MLDSLDPEALKRAEKLRVQDRLDKYAQEREDNLRKSGLLGSITDEDFAYVLRNECMETRCISAVEGWLGRKDQYLGLFGTAGCGKTVACAWAIAERGGVYVIAKRLERLFLAQFGEALHEQDRIMETRGILVLDDIGTELDSARFMSTLYEVLNSRQGSGRRTIITANMPLGAFKKRYDDPRLLSRLNRAVFVGNTGKDLRVDD